MPCRASQRARGGVGEVSRGSGYQLAFPAQCVFCSTREVAAPPSRPPSLGKRARQTPSSPSGTPTGGRKPRRTEISSGQPHQALSHSFCFSVPPCQQGAESDCAAPPLKVPTLIQSVRGRLRPLPRPKPSAHPFVLATGPVPCQSYSASGFLAREKKAPRELEDSRLRTALHYTEGTPSSRAWGSSAHTPDSRRTNKESGPPCTQLLRSWEAELTANSWSLETDF